MSEIWCAYCGKLGDHGSGSCPDLNPLVRIVMARPFQRRTVCFFRVVGGVHYPSYYQTEIGDHTRGRKRAWTFRKKHPRL